MSSGRRLRSKYKANRTRRRIEKIKRVSTYVLAAIAIAFLMWKLIPIFAEGGCSIRLGGD
jgi:hypothetical protein